MPVLMRTDEDIPLCFGGAAGKRSSSKSKADSAEAPSPSADVSSTNPGESTSDACVVGPMPARVCPVFLVSSVKGTRIPLLQVCHSCASPDLWC